MNLCDLIRCMRPAVVVSHARHHGKIRARHANYPAVIPVIHHRQTRARRILPQKDRRQLRNSRPAIHADFQKRNAVLRQRWNNPARVSRHVGHLGARCRLAEPLVERLRQRQPALDHRLVHHLRLPRKRQCVPRNVAARNRLLHRLAIRRRSLLQVFKQQPRTSRPHITPLAPGVRRARNLDRMREILVEVFMNHVVLRVDKPRIEVALEHHQHAFHFRVRLRFLSAQYKR